MSQQEQVSKFGPTPDSLGGFQLLCNGVAEFGDLFVQTGRDHTWVDTIQGFRTNSDGKVVDEYGRVAYEKCRIYRRGGPPTQAGVTAVPGPHHSSMALAPTLGNADARTRKAMPIATGVLDYFPDALAAVAHASLVGNAQHCAGKPLHWDKSKSADEADALVRHLIQRGTRDSDGVRHTAKVAWRALALLQREIDAEKAKS